MTDNVTTLTSSLVQSKLEQKPPGSQRPGKKEGISIALDSFVQLFLWEHIRIDDLRDITINNVVFAEISRVAGPVLIVLSLVLHVTSVTYCVLKRLRRARAEAGARARTEDTESLETQRSGDLCDPGGRLETECLLTRGAGDIACFPDGSLRSEGRGITNFIGSARS